MIKYPLRDPERSRRHSWSLHPIVERVTGFIHGDDMWYSSRFLFQTWTLLSLLTAGVLNQKRSTRTYLSAEASIIVADNTKPAPYVMTYCHVIT